MRLSIHLKKTCGIDVRVPLRRAQTHVSQQFLNRAQVGASLQQVGGERMAERVRADRSRGARHRCIVAHEAVDAAHAEARATVVEEERIG